jgi:hypothetical protein
MRQWGDGEVCAHGENVESEVVFSKKMLLHVGSLALRVQARQERLEAAECSVRVSPTPLPASTLLPLYQRMELKERQRRLMLGLPDKTKQVSISSRFSVAFCSVPKPPREPCQTVPIYTCQCLVAHGSTSMVKLAYWLWLSSIWVVAF